MKIYISADIEGITGVTAATECSPGKAEFSAAAAQMTKEVRAACDGANEAGADTILIKDAHGWAMSIDPNELTENSELIRGWSGDPFCMMEGIDESFDAAVMIGYHTAAGLSGNPLAHTLNGAAFSYIKINGQIVGEFEINSYAAALKGVPVCFISGDELLTANAKAFNPEINAYAVKSGLGASTLNVHPGKSTKEIRNRVKDALSGDLSRYLISMPKSFKLEVSFLKQQDAYRFSFYPGAKLISEKTIGFKTKDFYEILRILAFIS